MKKYLYLIVAAVFIIASCGQEAPSIEGNWKGKNHSGQDIQWTFDKVGKAIAVLGSKPQDMFYRIDNSHELWHLNLNSTVDTNTLRAIYRFTDSGKLVIGINKDPVTKRPTGFDAPGVQKIILTKE